MSQNVRQNYQREMIPYKGNSFVLIWPDHSMGANAFVFSLNENGKAEGMKMKAISPLTDFSYDFQDLDFKKFQNLLNKFFFQQFIQTLKL